MQVGKGPADESNWWVAEHVFVWLASQQKLGPCDCSMSLFCLQRYIASNVGRSRAFGKSEHWGQWDDKWQLTEFSQAISTIMAAVWHVRSSSSCDQTSCLLHSVGPCETSTAHSALVKPFWNIIMCRGNFLSRSCLSSLCWWSCKEVAELCTASLKGTYNMQDGVTNWTAEPGSKHVVRRHHPSFRQCCAAYSNCHQSCILQISDMHMCIWVWWALGGLHPSQVRAWQQ